MAVKPPPPPRGKPLKPQVRDDFPTTLEEFAVLRNMLKRIGRLLIEPFRRRVKRCKRANPYR